MAVVGQGATLNDAPMAVTPGSELAHIRIAGPKWLS